MEETSGRAIEEGSSTRMDRHVIDVACTEQNNKITVYNFN